MALTLDIHEIIRQLSIWRPIFHSEADFQFSLAWMIKEQYPNCEIRLDCNKASAALWSISFIFLRTGLNIYIS
jgi:hypothetical protein